MKKVILGVAGLVILSAAAVFSGQVGDLRTVVPFGEDKAKPVTNLDWNQHEGEFQFAMVSDRTGGHRPKVFSQAIARINLLQPEFVVCVGDLIEGDKVREENIKQWQEIDGYLGQLKMPFFYAVGNHDFLTPAAADVWKERLGRDQYHFLYRDALFLFLNVEDPPGIGNRITPERIAAAQKVLQQNPNPRWTFVILHRPLWNDKGLNNNGWLEIEKALGDRPCTIFCGHVHRYEKFVRQGHNYYQLATTGGSSQLRGVEKGEFDQVVWVTMKKDGPIFANLLVDSILAEDLTHPRSDETGIQDKNAKKGKKA